MTLFEALKAHIDADSTLSSGLAGGVHPGPVPQKSPVPVLTMRRISGSSGATHDGGAEGNNFVRIEFTIWGAQFLQDERLIQRLRTIFRGVNGKLGGVNGIRFQTSGFFGPRDVVDPVNRMRGIQLDVRAIMDEDDVA